MSDSDAPAPEQPESQNSVWLYLIAALVGTAAIIVLYFSFQGEQAVKPAAMTPSPKVQHSNEPARPEMKAASLPTKEESSEPEHTASEPVIDESKSAANVGSPEPVDNAIIPADHKGPPWALNLISLSTPDHAMEHLAEIEASGFKPEVVEVLIDGRHWFRVRIKGFATITAAKKMGEGFAGNREYRTLWVGGY